jgi:uncharacterized membrane protein
MPMRGSGQLDEISQAIGRVDAYVHEFRHGTNELKAMVNGAEVAAEKRHVTLKLELSSQLERGLDSVRADMAKGLDALRADLRGIDNRVSDLEKTRIRQEAQISTWAWIIDKWPFAALAAVLSTVVAWANGKIHL